MGRRCPNRTILSIIACLAKHSLWRLVTLILLPGTSVAPTFVGRESPGKELGPMTTTITRILYPTDFSEASMAVLTPVAMLARLFNAEVVLVHVIQPLPMAEGIGASSGYSPKGREYQREALIHVAEAGGRVVVALEGAEIVGYVTLHKPGPDPG